MLRIFNGDVGHNENPDKPIETNRTQFPSFQPARKLTEKAVNIARTRPNAISRFC